MIVTERIRPLLPPLREAVLDALSIVSPVACSGCGALDRSLCRACLSALTPHPRRVLDVEAPVAVWAALPYAAEVRNVILAYKDHGRTDAALALAHALRASVLVGLGAARLPGHAARATLVTIPSTRAAFRRRGYHPTALLLRRACLPAACPLRLVRRAEDQAGLSAADRSRNRFGAFRAPRRLAATACIVVDDIVTSGATVREATRAVEEAGGIVVAVSVLAHTALRQARSDAQRSPSDHSANRS